MTMNFTQGELRMLSEALDAYLTRVLRRGLVEFSPNYEKAVKELADKVVRVQEADEEADESIWNLQHPAISDNLVDAPGLREILAAPKA